MPYRYAFFDLDGTLIDSAPGIFNSARYALKKLGFPPPTQEQLNAFIGPPLYRSFMEHCGFSRTDAEHGIDLFREYYAEHGISECRLFDGIPALLEELTHRGVVCALATCKPHVFAKQLLQTHGLAPYFSCVSGPEIDGTRGEKQEVIEDAMKRLGIDTPAEVLMIGDRDNDVLGAARLGIDCAGALWGFGSREELLCAGAKYLCEEPKEVARCI